MEFVTAIISGFQTPKLPHLPFEYYSDTPFGVAAWWAKAHGLCILSNNFTAISAEQQCSLGNLFNKHLHMNDRLQSVFIPRSAQTHRNHSSLQNTYVLLKLLMSLFTTIDCETLDMLTLFYRTPGFGYSAKCFMKNVNDVTLQNNMEHKWRYMAQPKRVSCR